MGNVVFVQNDVWQNQQKGSLAVVLGLGPVYNPATEVPRGRHAQFFINPSVEVYTKTYLLQAAGAVGFFADVQRAPNYKWFDPPQVWDNPQRPSPRTVTDFIQSSDLFASHDTFGWPEYPYPPFWVNETRGTNVVLNSFTAYNPAPDVWLLKKQDKFTAPEQVWWTPQQPLSQSVGNPYVPYLNTLQQPPAKFFAEEQKWWDFKQPITANAITNFTTYNPAIDPTRLRPQAKWFDPQALWWDSTYRVSINATTFLPPPYNPGADVRFPKKPAIFASPDSWDTAAFGWAQKPSFIVINVPQAPPTPPSAFTIVENWQGRVVLSPKKAGENLDYPMDFISRLAVNETIATASVTCSVYSGVDPNPQLMVNGSAQIQGTVVVQAISGGIVGNIYELLYTVLSSRGQEIELAGYLSVVPDVP